MSAHVCKKVNKAINTRSAPVTCARAPLGAPCHRLPPGSTPDVRSHQGDRTPRRLAARRTRTRGMRHSSSFTGCSSKKTRRSTCEQACTLRCLRESAYAGGQAASAGRTWSTGSGRSSRRAGRAGARAGWGCRPRRCCCCATAPPRQARPRRPASSLACRLLRLRTLGPPCASHVPGTVISMWHGMVIVSVGNVTIICSSQVQQ